VPPYPVASNQRDTAPDQPQVSPDVSALRDEIRRMVIEELAQLTGRPGGSR
jgi:hypothetical protein